MPPPTPLISTLLLLLLLTSATTSALPLRTPTSSFLRSSCSSTLYPTLCLRTLASFPSSSLRSPRRLAFSSLLVTFRHARAAAAFVHALNSSSPSSPALSDCRETISDSVDQIRQSLQQMRNMGRRDGPRFPFSLSNVQTWASAALTDLTTCLDAFDEDIRADGALKAAVGRRVGVVMRVTSISLALINRIG